MLSGAALPRPSFSPDTQALGCGLPRLSGIEGASLDGHLRVTRDAKCSVDPAALSRGRNPAPGLPASPHHPEGWSRLPLRRSWPTRQGWRTPESPLTHPALLELRPITALVPETLAAVTQARPHPRSPWTREHQLTTPCRSLLLTVGALRSGGWWLRSGPVGKLNGAHSSQRKCWKW